MTYASQIALDAGRDPGVGKLAKLIRELAEVRDDIAIEDERGVRLTLRVARGASSGTSFRLRDAAGRDLGTWSDPGAMLRRRPHLLDAAETTSA